MTAIWFVSDTHFGHASIARYCPASRGRFVLPDGRTDVDAMDEEMIANWNAVVGPRDTVYHLGDFSFRGQGPTYAIVRRLRGRINFLRGNHDRLNKNVLDLFERVDDYREVTVDGQKLVLCHYPMATWNKAHRGSWMLHGHCHGTLRARETTRLDVGVDPAHALLGSLRPFSWDDVRGILSKRTYGPTDHHGDEGNDD